MRPEFIQDFPAPPDLYAVSSSQQQSIVCRAAPGECDVAEYCTSTSSVCPSDRFRDSSNVCRVAVGVCDATEYCSGASPDCPVDGVLASSTQCRSVLGVCDVAEYCDGTSKACAAINRVVVSVPLPAANGRTRVMAWFG